MFSRTFLLQIAYEYQLSPEQEEVFLRKFGESKNYEDIAHELSISKIACIQRMGEVYKKFGIEGDTRGKENKLRILLNQKHHQSIQPKNEQQEEYSSKEDLIFTEELIGGSNDFIRSDQANSLSEINEKVNDLMTRLQVNTPQEQINAQTIPLSVSAIQELTTPGEWVKKLRQKLHQSKGLNYIQQVLQQISFQLPEIIERVAATSKRTELEITLELLDKIESVIQIESLITWQEWLQKVETIFEKLNWQTPESVLESSRSRRERKNSLARCKLIKVAGDGDEVKPIVLLVEMKPENNQLINIEQPIEAGEGIEVIIEVRPSRNSSIPEGLKLEVLAQTGELISEAQADNNPLLLESTLSCERGEELSVVLCLNQRRFIEKIIIPV